jgi:hypothetical protein
VKASAALEVVFSQSCNAHVPEVLTFIQTYYGGTIRSQTRADRPQYRTEHSLHIRAKDFSVVLGYLRAHSALKSNQTTIAQQWLAATDQEEKLQCNQQLKSCKTSEAYNSVPIEQSMVCDEYIAGLFDAEGCVSAYLCDRALEIAQKNSTNLLKAVRSHLGVTATLSPTKLTLCSNDSIAHALKVMRPHLIVKKEQADLMLRLMSFPRIERKRKRAPDPEHAHLLAEIKSLKHI